MTWYELWLFVHISGVAVWIGGGVVAQVGSLVYDGSLRTQLEDLRRQLKQ